MEIKVRLGRAALLLALAIVQALLAACAARMASPAAATPSPAAEGSPTREGMEVHSGEQLVSRRAAALPIVDGRIDELWSTAEALVIPLTWGQSSTEHAYDLRLRSLHTGDRIAFLAQWPGDRPVSSADTVFNKFTLHWRIPEPAAHGLDCTVVCHTAFADDEGRFAYANAETIPPGGHEALSVGGGWDAGVWTLEWSRPLVSGNPFDLQFDDHGQTYPFLVKVFERMEGRPEPVSARHLLVLEP